MPSLIHVDRSGTQFATRTQREVSGAASKARVMRPSREVAGAELKCCAPLEALPQLSASPRSIRG